MRETERQEGRKPERLSAEALAVCVATRVAGGMSAVTGDEDRVMGLALCLLDSPRGITLAEAARRGRQAFRARTGQDTPLTAQQIARRLPRHVRALRSVRASYRPMSRSVRATERN